MFATFFAIIYFRLRLIQRSLIALSMPVKNLSMFAVIRIPMCAMRDHPNFILILGFKSYAAKMKMWEPVRSTITSSKTSMPFVNGSSKGFAPSIKIVARKEQKKYDIV